MSSKTFSILGKGLSLNDAAAIQPHLDALKALGPDVEEVHFGGNTLGVGASEALAKELKTLKNLKVRPSLRLGPPPFELTRARRSPTLQTSSPAA